jgi:hypothetical protein
VDCPVRLSVDSETLETPWKPFDVCGSGFQREVATLKRWWRAHSTPVAIEFADIALECALDAVCELEWRDEALKRLLIVTQSVPHYSPTAQMPLRTGWPCTREPPVCWRSRLEFLERRHKVRTTVATPAGAASRGHLGALRNRVWQRLAKSGDGVIEATEDTVRRWADRAFAAGVVA